jgi:hypothetical protein
MKFNLLCDEQAWIRMQIRIAVKMLIPDRVTRIQLAGCLKEVHERIVKRPALDRKRVERRTEARPPALPSTVFREPPHQWCRPHIEPGNKKL